MEYDLQMNNESFINDGGDRNRSIGRGRKAGGNNKLGADGHKQQSTLSSNSNDHSMEMAVVTAMATVALTTMATNDSKKNCGGG